MEAIDIISWRYLSISPEYGCTGMLTKNEFLQNLNSISVFIGAKISYSDSRIGNLSIFYRSLPTVLYFNKSFNGRLGLSVC